MEIADLSKERSTIIIAIVTLITIGLSLIVSTGQTLRQQEEARLQHLKLTARSVLQSVDISLRTGILTQNDKVAGLPSTAKFFRELQRSGEVMFVGLLDEKGGQILPSLEGGASNTILFPQQAIPTMVQTGTWDGIAKFGDRRVYVYAKHSQGLETQSLEPDAPKRNTFLVVGLDMTKHFAIYKGFKQNALFQAAYILIAAIFTWALAMALLKRRELAGKALQLERFQARLLDNLPDGLLIVSPDNVIRAANPAAHDVFQAKGSGLAGLSVSDLPEDLANCLKNLPLDSNANWEQVTVQGSHLEILSVPLKEHKEAGSRLVLIRDRTRFRELEKSLQDAEKMAALGTIAAGMAHEIRNPLSALRGFAQYFAKKFKGKEPDETYAQTMITEADRLNRVITDLLYLSRPRAVQKEKVDLLELSEGISNLLRLDLEGKDVQLEVSLESSYVQADADLLKQTVINLMLNSLDAMEAAGTEKKQIHIASAHGEDGVWIFVRDNGPGMDKQQIDQAFEPFYTTKSKGTGLGLALINKTMMEHEGKALIESSAGRGCTIALFFPDVEDEENYVL
jgi:two-component system, NtrC family, sensor histidine kinase HydH